MRRRPLAARPTGGASIGRVALFPCVGNSVLQLLASAKDVSSLSLAKTAETGLRIEEMHRLLVEEEGERFVVPDRRARRQTGHEPLISGKGGDDEFRASQLGDLQGCLERRAGAVRAEGLGADAEDDVAAIDGGFGEAGRQGQACIGTCNRQPAIVHCGVQQVHRRRADEGGDIECCRMVVDFLRRAQLLDTAVAHDGDAACQRHRLDLVMGDINHCGLEHLMQPLDLGAHLHAQLGVEIGERLVEEEDLRLAHQRAADRDALALAARELARLAIEEVFDLQESGGVAHCLVALWRRHLPHLQAEADVPVHRQIGIERIGLKDHGDVAVLRMHAEHRSPADPDVAARRLGKAGNDVEQRGLAAARRTKQHEELAAFERNVDAFQRLDLAIGLADVFDVERAHDKGS
ncbi:hypothetical protein RHECNPAF_35000121 [Rhizobium etli CNPAF512]|nr:hypothetical protein RHECNPAF_35000121 [Rhizobium etli CNPAF512]